MKREIKKMPALACKIDCKDIDGGVKQWLQEQAGIHDLTWFLAHADDGVIWGRMDNGSLLTSDTIDKASDVSPALRNETLWQARLFATHGELYLWRDGDNNWQARFICDATAADAPHWTEAIDEYQILWGTTAQSLDHGFTLMNDGARGLRHAVPLTLSTNGKERPLRLGVRHYLEKSKRNLDKGYTRIAVSRLFQLTTRECR